MEEVTISSHGISSFFNPSKKEWQCNCTCGAHWTHGEHVTDEKRKEIREAHVSYAKHEATKVL